MKTRVISGIFIGIVTVGVGLSGGVPAGLVLLVCALLGFHELCRAAGVLTPGGIESEQKEESQPITVDILKKRDRTNVLEILGYIATILYYGGLIFLPEEINLEFYTIVITVLLLLALLAAYVVTFPKFHADQVMTAEFAFLYVPVLMSYVYRARCLPYGIYVYTLIFFCTWICDTGAYFAGRAFGRHKMAPVLSPKKTIEGAVGGVALSTLFCFLLSLFMAFRHPEETHDFRAAFIIIGMVGSCISMIGDLAASGIKRNHNIKDYGDVIPGHGGILDRFDSVIFTAPIIYFLGVLLIKRVL